MKDIKLAGSLLIGWWVIALIIHIGCDMVKGFDGTKMFLGLSLFLSGVFFLVTFFAALNAEFDRK